MLINRGMFIFDSSEIVTLPKTPAVTKKRKQAVAKRSMQSVDPATIERPTRSVNFSFVDE